MRSIVDDIRGYVKREESSRIEQLHDAIREAEAHGDTDTSIRLAREFDVLLFAHDVLVSIEAGDTEAAVRRLGRLTALVIDTIRSDVR